MAGDLFSSHAFNSLFALSSSSFFVSNIRLSLPTVIHYRGRQIWRRWLLPCCLATSLRYGGWRHGLLRRRRYMLDSGRTPRGRGRRVGQAHVTALRAWADNAILQRATWTPPVRSPYALLENAPRILAKRARGTPPAAGSPAFAVTGHFITCYCPSQFSSAAATSHQHSAMGHFQHRFLSPA